VTVIKATVNTMVDVNIHYLHYLTVNTCWKPYWLEIRVLGNQVWRYDLL